MSDPTPNFISVNNKIMKKTKEKIKKIAPTKNRNLVSPVIK